MFLCVVFISIYVFVQHLRRDVAYDDKNIIKLPEMTSVLSRRDENKDAVFFIETSATGFVKPRFVCSLESAAVAYSEADVYLLMVYSPHVLLRTSGNEALYNVLQLHRNIQILRVDLDILFRDSPLEQFHKSGVLNTSRYIEAHTADILRMFVLWKYGGKYIDLDIVTVRNLTEKNYIIAEANFQRSFISNAFIAFEKNFYMAEYYIFERFTYDFDGLDWYANGPRLWTKTMAIYAGVENIREMNAENIKPFVMLDYFDLYPIEWFELYLYFNENLSEEALSRIAKRKNLIGMHIGNNISSDKKVLIGSKQAYSLIAKKWCPCTYSSCVIMF